MVYWYAAGTQVTSAQRIAARARSGWRGSSGPGFPIYCPTVACRVILYALVQGSAPEVLAKVSQ